MMTVQFPLPNFMSLPQLLRYHFYVQLRLLADNMEKPFFGFLEPANVNINQKRRRHFERLTNNTELYSVYWLSSVLKLNRKLQLKF